MDGLCALGKQFPALHYAPLYADLIDSCVVFAFDKFLREFVRQVY